jgi:hypothetical protein
MSNHEELSFWTVDMNTALSDLAQQVVNIRGPILEEEWHIPEQEVQP